MNYSRQRDLVLKALYEMKSHPSADLVYENVRNVLPNISLATVYRNLNQLADGKIIRRIDGLDGSTRFDHQMHEHYHFICIKCDKIIDIPHDIAANLVKKTEAETGLAIESYDLSFRGICHSCMELK